MAATKVKTLAEQKQDLIARSDMYRQALANDVGRINASLGWLPKTFSLLKAAAPLLVMAGPLAAWSLRGRKKKVTGKDGANEKVGKLAKIWGVLRIAQQVIPFVHGFMRAWPATKNSEPPYPEPARQSVRSR